MASKDNCPCNGCEQRAIGCHSGCGRYSEWSQERQAQNEARHAEKVKQNDIFGYHADLMRKIGRRKR